LSSKSKKQSIRTARQAQRRRQRLMTTIIWVGAAVILIGVIGFFIWNGARPAEGEAIPIVANASLHAPEGENPGPFNSDPPTSGRHYARSLNAGFYHESDSVMPDPSTPAFITKATPLPNSLIPKVTWSITWNMVMSSSGTTVTC